jgi:hypothetical protein
MILRGLKLQEAIQLAAEGRLTESEIAMYLDVSPGTLAKLNRNPIFIRRAGQSIRSIAECRFPVTHRAKD